MKLVKFLVSVVIVTVILFLWSGISQMFPWGVPSSNTLRSTSNSEVKNFQAPNLKSFKANELTTDKFDEEMVNKVNTLTTDKTFSWIVTKPISYYNPMKYFFGEIITQLFVALILTLIILFTAGLKINLRILFVVLIGILSSVSIYGQLFNWWGLTVQYALGASINLILGWVLGSLIPIIFIYKHRLKDR